MPRQNDFLDGIQWSKYTKPILPHQMTPSQFREHPLAVHHGTTDLGFWAEDIGANHYNSKPMSFAGDRLQALDRIDMKSDYQQAGGWMHHYWAVPTGAEARNYYEDDDASVHNEGEPDVHGNVANRGPLHSEQLERKSHDLGYFRNVYEGIPNRTDRVRSGIPGSPSVAMLNEPMYHGFVTHSQFVEDAIKQGKANEVHPETMALYRKRDLDSTRIQPSYIKREVRGESPWRSSEFRQRASTGEIYDQERPVPQTTPREELPVYKDNKPLNMTEIRGQVKSGYASRVRKTYRSFFNPDYKG
jgi:hypothetical protein